MRAIEDGRVAPIDVGPSARGVARHRRSHPRRPIRRPLRAVSVSLLLGGLAATAASVVVVRNVMADQEHRLLTERANEVAALLSTSFAPAGASVRALATAGNGGPNAFSEASQAFTAKGVAVTLLLTRDGAGFRVVAGGGSGPPAGSFADAPRAALAGRALAASDFVTGVFPEAGSTRLALAVRTSLPGGVAEYESTLTPSKPTVTTSTSPFHELVGSVYATPTADPASLVFTTRTAPARPGRSVGTTFSVGADRWFVSVSAKTSLIGSFAETTIAFRSNCKVLASPLDAFGDCPIKHMLPLFV